MSRWFFAGLALAPLMAARADQLQQHKQLVDQFVQQRHADPLVADCAAHASFVVPTAPGYDSVEFADGAFDTDHAHIEPWQKPFDNGKQKIDVATVVTLDGIGRRKTGSTDTLHIRCGYNEGRMMAFSYTSPLPQVEPVHHAASKRTRHGKHTMAKSAVKHKSGPAKASTRVNAKTTARAPHRPTAKAAGAPPKKGTKPPAPKT